MILRHLFLLTLGALLASPITAAPTEPDDDFELRQLTEDNFRSSTAHGLWLVEHYSPKCGHCRAFAPTWTRLAKEKQHLERLAGFKMAQVNCLAQGDLCNANGIKFYPQLMLYSNGKPLPAYSGDRSHSDLSKFIDEHSALYARGQLALSIEASDVDEPAAGAFVRANPEGKVAEVDAVALKALLGENGENPALVEFYAPWCSHCKKLKPIYAEVAESLKGKINVVAVDCEANKALCREHGVPAYPTIKLFQRGKSNDYNGARSVAAMRKFALRAVEAATIKTIKFDEFDDIVRNDDAFFLYLQNFDTTVSDLELVKSSFEPLLPSVAAYTSSDPHLYTNLSIANPPPTSLLLAFSSHSALPVGSISFPLSSTESLQRFLAVHRYPTITQLTSANYQEIMRSDTRAIVVLGAVHKGEEGQKEVKEFEKFARAWKRGGRGFSQPVWFVWVDGDKWKGWLRQAYGISKKHLPAAVVVDPPLSEYYDMTIEGSKIAFEGSSIFSVLEGVYQHFLRPKRSESALQWGSRSATMGLINLGQMGIDHPIASLLTVVGSVALFVYLLQKCIPRDPREEGRTPNGAQRLD